MVYRFCLKILSNTIWITDGYSFPSSHFRNHCTSCSREAGAWIWKSTSTKALLYQKRLRLSKKTAGEQWFQFSPLQEEAYSLRCPQASLSDHWRSGAWLGTTSRKWLPSEAANQTQTTTPMPCLSLHMPTTWAKQTDDMPGIFRKGNSQTLYIRDLLRTVSDIPYRKHSINIHCSCYCIYSTSNFFFAF